MVISVKGFYFCGQVLNAYALRKYCGAVVLSLGTEYIPVLGAGFHNTREEPHGLGMDCMTL